MLILLHIFKWFVIGYIGVLFVLFFAQRNLIYFPDKSSPVVVAGVRAVSVKSSDGLDLRAWYVPPSKSDGPVILYFHGNAGNFSHRLPKVRAYIRLGYGVLLAEYRGYGGNNGQPTEEGFYDDGRAYARWLLNESPNSPLIIYGESIGTGTAVQMALEFKHSALILETPFSSLADIAAERYWFVPVRLLLLDKFDNISKIAKINSPVLIMHGHKDQVIGFNYAKALYNAANEPKEFQEFAEGTHNNLYDFAAADFVISFIEDVMNSDVANQ